MFCCFKQKTAYDMRISDGISDVCSSDPGVMPLHSWLPEAHPAAPSHVSALMSGVMVAMPTYVVVRLLLPFRQPVWVGTIVLLLGALSAGIGRVACRERV